MNIDDFRLRLHLFPRWRHLETLPTSMIMKKRFSEFHQQKNALKNSVTFKRDTFPPHRNQHIQQFTFQEEKIRVNESIVNSLYWTHFFSSVFFSVLTSTPPRAAKIKLDIQAKCNQISTKSSHKTTLQLCDLTMWIFPVLVIYF